MRHWRRNADSRIRRLERAASQGDLEAHVALLRERLRLRQLTLERIAMSAYLGHPAARAVGVPDLPSPIISREPWEFGSRSRELLDKGPVSPKIATLFCADCAARALNGFGRMHGEDTAYELAVECVEVSRVWVTSDRSEFLTVEGRAGDWRDAEDPQEFADNLFNVMPRGTPRADTYAFDAAMHVAAGARRQPSSVSKSAVRYALMAPRQAILGPLRTHQDVPGDVLLRANRALEIERDWQDQHFASALLLPEWPMVPIQ